MKGWESLPFDLVSSKASNKCEGCLCMPVVQLSQPLLRDLFLMYLTKRRLQEI